MAEQMPSNTGKHRANSRQTRISPGKQPSRYQADKIQPGQIAGQTPSRQDSAGQTAGQTGFSRANSRVTAGQTRFSRANSRANKTQPGKQPGKQELPSRARSRIGVGLQLTKSNLHIKQSCGVLGSWLKSWGRILEPHLIHIDGRGPSGRECIVGVTLDVCSIARYAHNRLTPNLIPIMIPISSERLHNRHWHAHKYIDLYYIRGWLGPAS